MEILDKIRNSNLARYDFIHRFKSQRPITRGVRMSFENAVLVLYVLLINSSVVSKAPLHKKKKRKKNCVLMHPIPS